MRAGDFETAWQISDAALGERLRSARDNAALPRHLQSLWDGRPLRGQRVLVHCYHGLGDTLQFVRLLPRLRREAAEVTLWAQPALLGLLRGLKGMDRLEALHDGASSCERDADVELMELAHAQRLCRDTIPAAVPYLDLLVPRRTRSGSLRVGIVWRAGAWDARRSIPAAALAPLASVRGLRWVSLQFPRASAPLRALDAGCRDLIELARRTRALDLLISVDTMNAHLAGALGCPVWVLLPTPCDWRWMERGETTPWYPTMRLLRQPTSGDWSSVIARLAGELARWRDTHKHVRTRAQRAEVAIRGPGAQ